MFFFRPALAVCVIAALFVSDVFARSDDGSTVNPNVLLIQFKEQPLNEYSGGVDGLAATSRSATGQRLNPGSSNSLAYLSWLRARQDEHLAAISARLGRQVEVIFRYDVLLNGVAVRAQGDDFSRIRAMGQVKAIAYDRNYPLNTDRGPQWIGAPGVWDGSGTGGLGSTRGEGVVVGVLDTGINFGHPSFSDTPDDAHVYVNPNGSGNFLGWCDPGHPMHDPAYACNDKLIGAWDYADAVSGIEMNGPVDDDGHGSHTSSTAAGNTLTSPAISGVAPHANIIMYDVCYEPAPGEQDTCPLSATSAAAQQALVDGVDVINFSIGGGSSPWSQFDIDSYFLDLVANGTFVSTSAGNSGPAAATVGHIGPWVSASGASTHDRVGVDNEVVDMSGGNSPPADISGQSRTGAYGPATVVYAGDFANGDPNPEQCLNPFPANTWTGGEIVLCDRGTIARVQKCANIALGGAAGCILADSSVNSSGPVADPHVIPATHVNLANGDTLRTWLASGAGHTATITASVVNINAALGDIMADFSSRGPASIDVIKPDVTNPGVNIFAAVQAGSIIGFPGQDFGILSGTSMSSPHTAGSAALLMSLHPTWSPPEVKSALMSTADTTVLKEDGVTDADPFDRGAGRVQLGPASQAGLVLDESEANFLAANPDNLGRPETLNLASMMESRCAIACTFTRTVRNARSFSTDWTFSQTAGTDISISANPAAFTLASGATQELEFTVSVTGGAGEFLFGEGTFTEDTAQAPAAHFTVAVREASLNLDEINIDSEERNGMAVVEGVVTTGASDLQIGFAGVVPLQRSRDEVEQDPNNSSPYDNDMGTVTYWLNGLVDARRIHASTLESEAPDLDLFVGRDINMDGIPQANEEVCNSTSPSADEECEVFDPEDGNWWIRVQNWQGSGNPTDTYTARFAAVGPADEGNFSASPSNSSPASGEAFDVTINWNFPPTGGNGPHIGVVDFGTMPGNPDDLDTIPLNFFNDRVANSGFE